MNPTSPPGNLLVLLYRLAHRQQENFTTVSAAHLLEYLLRAEPQAADRVLDWLTNSSFFSQRSTAGKPLSIRTQAYTEQDGIPDIRIESDDIDVIIEVKLDGGLTFEQMDAYDGALAKGARRWQALVGLTGGRACRAAAHANGCPKLERPRRNAPAGDRRVQV